MKRGERFVVNVAPEIDSRSAESLIRKLNVLLRASMIYSLRLEMNTALKVILDLARELADFEKAIFYLYDEDEKTFYPALFEGFGDSLPASCRHGNPFVEWTVENRLPIRVEEVDSKELESLVRELSSRSLVSIPILSGSTVPAVLQTFSSQPKHFSDDTIRFLWILTLQLEGLFQQMRRPSFHETMDLDPFTGLPTRARFEEELNKEFLRSRRNNRSFSLFFIEVDNFHRLKEQFVSLGGGILLREVAEQIQPMMRKIDVFAKYSESVMALLLPETDLRQGVLMANRIRTRIASHPLTTLGAVPYLKLTVSIGVSSFPQCMTVSDLLAEASRNLQASHEVGGNQAVSRYSSGQGVEERPVSMDLQNLLDTLGKTFNIENLLTHLVEFFSRLSGADRVSILMADETGKRLVFKHGVGFQGFEEEIQKSVLAIEDSICGQALKKRQALLVEDVEAFKPQRARHGLRYNSPSFLSIPLIYQDQPIGVINFSNRKDRGPFTRKDLDIVVPHVQAVSKLLAEGKRFNSVQSSFLHDTADILLNIAENKSPYLKGHSERVAQASYHLAKALNIPEAEAIRIANAARFHDLGRIAIDESVLGKAGPLDTGERFLVNQHPLWSTRILQSFPGLDLDLSAVRAHHERFDGKGYPDGLMGEEIPLGGRIIAVADAFDAMTHQRPFRAAMSNEDAHQILEQKMGTHFDARVVKAFRETLH